MSTVFSATAFVHLLSFDPLVRRQETENLRLHPFMLDDLIRMDLGLLVRDFPDLCFVKLSISRRGFQLFVKLFHLLMASFFAWLDTIHQRFDLGFLFFRQTQCPGHVLHHLRTGPMPSLRAAMSLKMVIAQPSLGRREDCGRDH